MVAQLLYKTTIVAADVAQTIGVGLLFYCFYVAVVAIIFVASSVQTAVAVMIAVAGFGFFCSFAAVEMVTLLVMAVVAAK